MKKTVLPAVVLLFATSAFADEQPTEFVTQVLEPTGGNIVRPKEWFYTEHHHGPVFVWTISREATSGNQPYTTGVRIQTFMHVKEAPARRPKNFCALSQLNERNKRRK